MSVNKLQIKVCPKVKHVRTHSHKINNIKTLNSLENSVFKTQKTQNVHVETKTYTHKGIGFFDKEQDTTETFFSPFLDFE